MRTNRLAGTVLGGAAACLLAFVVAAAAPANGSAGRTLRTFGWSSRLTPDQARQLSANATERVIVLLRNQHTGLSGSGATAQRAHAFAADREPIVAQLRQLDVPRLVTYKTVNAVATTVSPAEAANLRRDPAVLAVGPDAVVKGPSTNANLLPHPMRAPVSGARQTTPTRAAVSGSALCGSANAPLLEPQALHLINADNRKNANSPITSGPKSAHSLGYTGAGVSIAVFPDGMDPNLPDFQRNGQSAVTDYRDFSGEGTSAKAGGGEAFGDVGSIVSQANTTFNLNQEINPDFAKTGGTCDVKVLGVAPGANVDVMKVFGNSNVSFTSVILQGIDWAIQHDHVDILSISLGVGGLPTSAAQQSLTAILENAMADGTTVVASTGDSSPSNTEGSPALDPGVIGVAASTSYRIFAQTNLFLYDMAEAVHSGSAPSYRLGRSTPGWLDNQVSTLSSSGVTEDRRLPDLIAPGDLNWADCSTDTSTYTDCENGFGGDNIGLEDFGGTSESAPLTSGVAALVIQAYRRSHQNQTPAPAVVRQILFSSATDLGVAAENQGAGLLNALRAVQLAKSYGTHAAPGGLMHSPDSIADLGNAGATHSHAVTVTNTGRTKARIRPVLRTLGRPRTLAGGHLSLFESGRGPQGSCGGHKTAKYFTGETIPELNCKTFRVPRHTDLLDSRIGWNPLQTCSGCTAGEPTVREILIDPRSRYGQYSDPQGDGAGFADAQIHQPLAGRWTLLIFGRHTSNYEGSVSFQEIAQTFRAVHHAVEPASKLVRPGKRASFTVKVPAPATPGLFTGAVVFHSDRQTRLGTIPVVSEAKVSVTAKKAGHFTGTLIGGNGRPGAYAQELSYELTVPKGVHDLDVNVKASHEGYLLLGQLVDPNGNAVDNQISFQEISAFGASDNTNAVQLVWANPAPGTWRVNVANGLFYLPGLDVYSGLTHAKLKGTVSFDTSRVTGTGLPSGTLTAGSTVIAHVQVKNTGVEPETYQLDPRTVSQTPYAGSSLTPAGGKLPVTYNDSIPQYVVPPFSTQLKVTAATTGTTPIEFDLSPYWGAPDVASPVSSGGVTSVTLTNPFASAWAPAPTEVGPFSSPATPEDYTTSATVTTLGFDANATPDTGDVWATVLGGASQPVHPLFLLPGQSGTMNLTFTVPTAAAGTVVSGVVSVETFPTNSYTTGVGDWSSDVLSVLRYSYTVG
jgi:Subtilase family